MPHQAAGPVQSRPAPPYDGTERLGIVELERPGSSAHHPSGRTRTDSRCPSGGGGS
jgi:hypothetical protein